MEQNINQVDQKELKKEVSLYTKTFLFLGLALLTTALATIGFAIMFAYFFPYSENAFTIYLIFSIVAGVGTMITSLVTTFKVIKNKSSAIIPFIIYVLFMSLLLANISYFIADPYTIGVSLVITSLIFFTICICTLIFKSRYRLVFGLLIGLGVAVGIMSLVNFLILPFLFTGSEAAFDAFMQTFYIVQGITLILSVVVTVADLMALKSLAATGENRTNYALLMALNLYNDFIWILIRVIILVSRNRGRN